MVYDNLEYSRFYALLFMHNEKNYMMLLIAIECQEYHIYLISFWLSVIKLNLFL